MKSRNSGRPLCVGHNWTCCISLEKPFKQQAWKRRENFRWRGDFVIWFCQNIVHASGGFHRSSLRLIGDGFPARKILFTKEVRSEMALFQKSSRSGDHKSHPRWQREGVLWVRRSAPKQIWQLGKTSQNIRDKTKTAGCVSGRPILRHESAKDTMRVLSAEDDRYVWERK